MMRSETTREENMEHYWRAYLLSLISLVIICFLLFVGTVSGSSVNLISPENSTVTNLNNNSLQFVYNHTGSLAGIVNCTLYINGNPVDYSTDVPANTNQSVYSNQSWSKGDHYWYVNCTNGTDTESSLDIGQNYTFTADFTPPNITSWYTNATNASSPQDLMFLVPANDSIFFNITVENPNDTSYTWFVNKVDQNNSVSNFTFNVPDCDHQNDPSSCIWEIHVIATDTAGNDAHHEWVISTLNESEAPDIFDYFTDKKYQSRTETDPWGRALPNWTIDWYADDSINTNFSSDGYLCANPNHRSFILNAPSTTVYGTWKFRYRFPAGAGGWDGDSSSFTFKFINTPYDIYFWEHKCDGHGYFIHGGTNGTDMGKDSGNWPNKEWRNVTIVRRTDGWLYMWIDDMLAYRWNEHSWKGDSGETCDSIKVILTHYKPTVYPEGVVYMDNIEIYKNKFLFPEKTIEYKEYIDNLYWDGSKHAPLYRTGIVVRGDDIRLSDIYDAVGDSSKFAYNGVIEGKPTYTCYTDLVVDEGSELIIENETLKMHCDSDGEHQIALLYGATIKIENSTITSDTEHFYNWRISGSTHYGYPLGIKNTHIMFALAHTSLASFIAYNSVIDNSAQLFFNNFHEVILKNTAITNLNEADTGNYSAKDGTEKAKREYVKGNKSFFVFLNNIIDILDFEMNNVSITGKNSPIDVTFMPYDWLGKYNLYNVNLENENIVIRKSAKYYPVWQSDWPTYLDSSLGLVNCKYKDLIVATDKAKLIPKYYLDVKVVEGEGYAVSGANVTVTNEIDDANYPAENMKMDRYLKRPKEFSEHSFYYFESSSPLRTTSTKTDGHTPLPSDREHTLVIADYVKDNSGIQDFTYTISASKDGKTASMSSLDIDESWYREDPDVPTKTIVCNIDTGNCWIEGLATGTLSGKVTDKDTGQPIIDATVTADSYSNTTNSTGGYTITLQVGNYTVTATKTGYYSNSTTAQILENQTTIVDIILSRHKRKLPVAKPMCATGIAILIVVVYWRYRRRRKRMRSGGLIVLVPSLAIEWSSFIYN